VLSGQAISVRHGACHQHPNHNTVTLADAKLRTALERTPGQGQKAHQASRAT
jgi:hypothetical protein